MAKEFFKNLPDTTTPINASRLNGFLDGEESMGSIVVEDITCKNKFDKNTITSGYRLVTTGPYKDALYFISDFIEVNPNDIYTVNYEVNAYTRMLFYNDNKGIISYNETNATFTTPSNAKYVRIGQLLTELDNVQLEKGSVATDYVEHKEFDNKQIYSTNEQVIGTWMGKPLYRKVLTATTSTTEMIGTNLFSFDDYVDLIINFRVFVVTSGNIKQFGAGNEAWVRRVDKTIAVSNNNSSYYSSPAYCIIEYTKTTD